MSFDNLLPRVFLHPIAPTRCVILNFVRMQFLGNKQERPWDQQRVKKRVDRQKLPTICSVGAAQ